MAVAPAAATSRRTTTSNGPFPSSDEPGFGERGPDLRVVAIESPFHDEALGPRAHERRVGPPAREEEQRVHDEGLAGAGLPRQDRQPLAERDLDVLEDGEVADAKGRQHASSGPVGRRAFRRRGPASSAASRPTPNAVAPTG